MSVRPIVVCVAALFFFAVGDDARGQTGQSVLLTASAGAAGGVGEGPRTGQCSSETKTSTVGGTIAALDYCDLEFLGNFLANATASGNQTGNSLSASASMSSQAPLFQGFALRSAAGAYASVAFSDTLTITSSGSFALRVVFSAAATSTNCDQVQADAAISVFASFFGTQLAEANPCSTPNSSINLDNRFAPIAFTAGQTLSLGYSIVAQASGGTGGTTGSVQGSADASHTLYIVFEPVTSGAAFTSTSGIDYTRTPETVNNFRYQFTGFGEPVSMGVTNTAQAGRTIPIVWRLTDLTGTPIGDPGSFAGIFSFQTACNTATQTESVEAYTSGASSLQYLGGGYWQFNWKTEKSYAKTCRRMYLKLSDGQMSDQVKLQFK